MPFKGVEESQEPYLASLREDLMGHLEGDDAPEGVPNQMIRPFRLHGPDCFHVVRSHILYTHVIRLSSIQASRQESVHRLILAQVKCQAVKFDDVASESGDHVERWSISFRLNWHERRPFSGFLTACATGGTNKLSELPNRSSLE